MIGDLPIWAIIFGGVMSLIIAIRIWIHEDHKKKREEKEKEEYRKKWEESAEFRKQEKEKYEQGYNEWLATRQRDKNDNDQQ